MSIHHLGSMTWREVKEFVHERVVALLPLGALEAHGPHLPVNTDVVIATEMAKRGAKKLSAAGKDVLVYPPLVFSPAPFARAFPGTVDIPKDTYGAYLVGVLAHMAEIGVRTVCLVTCHVDPAHLDVLRGFAKGPPSGNGLDGLRIIFPDPTKEPWVFLMPEEFRRGGAHAGQYETSCMLAIGPDKVREEIRKSLPKIDVNLGRAILAGFTRFEDCGGPEAYFGDPASANATKGEEYLEALATIVCDAVTESKT